jgi:hypothetical protein
LREEWRCMCAGRWPCLGEIRERGRAGSYVREERKCDARGEHLTEREVSTYHGGRQMV